MKIRCECYLILWNTNHDENERCLAEATWVDEDNSKHCSKHKKIYEECGTKYFLNGQKYVLCFKTPQKNIILKNSSGEYIIGVSEEDVDQIDSHYWTNDKGYNKLSKDLMYKYGEDNFVILKEEELNYE